MNMRLLDTQIEDVVIRAQMYKDVLNAVNNKVVQLQPKEIQVDEVYRSDLIAYRVYALAELAWLVDLLLDREDPAEPIVMGKTIYFPPLAFVRDRIRYYQGLANA